MGNSSSTHELNLLKVRILQHDVYVYADESATLRENQCSDIQVVSESKFSAKIDPEGGIVALAVWPGAIELTRALLSTSKLSFSNKLVLEIGCGVALPGISISKFLNPKQVVVTDRESARTTVEASIAANNEQDRCQFDTFDWGSSDNLEKFSALSFDYVIGSEIVYAEEQAPLINALLAVTQASPKTRIILSYRNRSEQDENYFNVEILKNFKIDEKISENIFIFSRKID